MPNYCLTLLCPVIHQERLLDHLLLTPEIPVFSSHPAAAHGLHQRELSTTEQVLGQARVTQIVALIDQTDSAGILETLKQEFSGIGLRYWLVPVIDAGEFL